MDIQESVVLLLVASYLFMLPYDKVVAISTSNQQPVTSTISKFTMMDK